jgi:chemosensory pili system protein ChpE
MASSVAWAFFCAAAVARLFRSTGARWRKVTYRFCAAVFLALALSLLRDLIVQSAQSQEKVKLGTAVECHANFATFDQTIIINAQQKI